MNTVGDVLNRVYGSRKAAIERFGSATRVGNWYSDEIVPKAVAYEILEDAEAKRVKLRLADIPTKRLARRAA